MLSNLTRAAEDGNAIHTAVMSGIAVPGAEVEPYDARFVAQEGVEVSHVMMLRRGFKVLDTDGMQVIKIGVDKPE